MTKVLKGILIAVVAFAILSALVIGVVVGFGVYGWKQAQREGNEAATVRNIQTIAALQIQYYNTHNRNFGTFDQLVSESLLDKRFAGGTPIVDGYVYDLRVKPATPGQTSSYTLNADPDTSRDGTKHFYVDSMDGAVRVNSNRPASAADPPDFR
jgi:type II secretory pathway pseudopilin PulG